MLCATVLDTGYNTLTEQNMHFRVGLIWTRRAAWNRVPTAWNRVPLRLRRCDTCLALIAATAVRIARPSVVRREPHFRSS